MTRYIALDSSGMPKLVEKPEQASHFVLAVGGLAAPHIEAKPLPRTPDEEILLQVVADHYGVKVVDLRSSSRRAKLCRARHVAAYLLRRHQLLTWSEIGELLERDHTTIIAGAKKIQKQADSSPELLKELEQLTAAAQV